MSRFSQVRELERQVRASKPYHDWVKRNKTSSCLKCDSAEQLECHHVVELYHIILGLWKLYGNEAEVLRHATDMHDADMCESVTLCNDCHGQLHPGRSVSSEGQEPRIELWTTLPRNLEISLAHSKSDKRKDALGLIPFQTLLGLGWYILNGYMDSRMVEFNRRRFAELIGKSPCTSFNHAFDRAVRQLKRLGILLASHRRGNDVELHISKDYINLLIRNPWFFPLREVQTNNMCVLTLRLFLSMQSRRNRYRIGIEKLRGHLGVIDTDDYKTAQRLRKACEAINWATMSYDKGMCQFELQKRRAVPIHSLRRILDDSVQQGT